VADTSLVCGESTEWVTAAVIAALAIVLVCVGLPLVLLLAVHKWRKGSARQQQRIALLTASYTPSAWYYEAIDLLRKWMMNSVVLWVRPNSRWQLIFGAYVATFAIALSLYLKPYRERVCGAAANAALFQLQLTYIVALAFHEDGEATPVDDHPALGVALVALNVVCFLLLLAYIIYASFTAATDVAAMGAAPLAKWSTEDAHYGCACPCHTDART
jgi:hypothetical protein